MTSRIVPTNIDGTFPVAGQDNSSQGFRDNFTNIKNNLTFARNEISDLQSKVILTAALEGTTLSNDMAGTQIYRPQLRAWTQALVNLGDLSGAAVIDFNAGNFHKITAAGSIDLTLVNWPASVGSGALGYGAVRVWIVINDISHTIGIPEVVTIGTNDIAGYNANTRDITFDRPGNYIFDFSSVDSGANFFIADPMRNRSTFRDPSFYFNSTVSPSLYLGFNANSLPIGQSIEPSDDTINAVGGMNLITAGNLAAGGPNHHYLGTGGEIPGYSIISARGNLSDGEVSPVVDGDYLGYFDASANVTLTDAPNWKRLSSIDFFAKGVDVDTGLGGNIGLFTAPDGSTTTVQAVGIENDQSVKVFGNLITSNVFVPTSSTDSGTTGQISFDNDNVYICLGPNNWKKSSLTSF